MASVFIETYFHPWRSSSSGKSSPDVSGSSTQCCGDTNKMSSRKQLFYLFEGHYNHRVQVLYTICFARIIHSFLARFLYLYVYYIYILYHILPYTQIILACILFSEYMHILVDWNSNIMWSFTRIYKVHSYLKYLI